MAQKAVLAQLFVTRLEHDLQVGNSVLPAGTDVLLLPHTTAGCVMLNDGQMLEDALLQRAATFARLQTEIITMSDRLTRYELAKAKE